MASTGGKMMTAFFIIAGVALCFYVCRCCLRRRKDDGGGRSERRAARRDNNQLSKVLQKLLSGKNSERRRADRHSEGNDAVSNPAKPAAKPLFGRHWNRLFGSTPGDQSASGGDSKGEGSKQSKHSDKNSEPKRQARKSAGLRAAARHGSDDDERYPSHDRHKHDYRHDRKDRARKLPVAAAASRYRTFPSDEGYRSSDSESDGSPNGCKPQSSRASSRDGARDSAKDRTRSPKRRQQHSKGHSVADESSQERYPSSRRQRSNRNRYGEAERHNDHPQMHHDTLHCTGKRTHSPAGHHRWRQAKAAALAHHCRAAARHVPEQGDGRRRSSHTIEVYDDLASISEDFSDASDASEPEEAHHRPRSRPRAAEDRKGAHRLTVKGTKTYFNVAENVSMRCFTFSQLYYGHRALHLLLASLT